MIFDAVRATGFEVLRDRAMRLPPGCRADGMSTVVDTSRVGPASSHSAAALSTPSGIDRPRHPFSPARDVRTRRDRSVLLFDGPPTDAKPHRKPALMSDPPSAARDADDDKLLRELDRAYKREDPLEVRRLTGALLGSYWLFIRNIARGRLRGVSDPVHEAEDVAQEVMRKLAGALANKRSFNKAFRRVVLDNIDFALKDYWKAPARKDESDPQDLSELPPPKGAPNPLPSEIDQARDVDTLLSDLRPRDREVVLLRLYAGMTAPEVGEHLNISMSAVYGAMNRGVEALRASPRTAHVRKRHERSAEQA